MPRVFTKENMQRLTKYERSHFMWLQMHQGGTGYGGGGYLPDDCSECGACGQPILGTGWCSPCNDEYTALERKALGENVHA